MNKGPVLYISSILPARSETFVYREIFALRTLGVAVVTASVHPPEENLGTPELEALAAGAVPVYGTGGLRLVLDALREGLGHPLRALGVFGRAVGDAVSGRDIRGLKRLKIVIQAVAALALVHRIRPLGVVHIHAHMAHVPATMAMYAARQLGIRFSFTGHANDIFPNRALLKEKVERALFVSCISRWHREFYFSLYPKDPERLPIIRCGVDTDKEAYTPVVPGETLRILGVGRLVRKKGFDLLLEAVDRIGRKDLVKIELTLAGSGPEEPALRARAAGLAPSVDVIMPGSVDNDIVMDLMARCDLFVLPLRISEGDRDGIPVVLMEAMSRGRCVICGDLETIRELVEHGESGYLFPMEDGEALEQIMEDLAVDPGLRERTGKNARQRIVEEFAVTGNARTLVQAMKNAGVNL